MLKSLCECEKIDGSEFQETQHTSSVLGLSAVVIQFVVPKAVCTSTLYISPFQLSEASIENVLTIIFHNFYDFCFTSTVPLRS